VFGLRSWVGVDDTWLYERATKTLPRHGRFNPADPRRGRTITTDPLTQPELYLCQPPPMLSTTIRWCLVNAHREAWDAVDSSRSQAAVWNALCCAVRPPSGIQIYRFWCTGGLMNPDLDLLDGHCVSANFPWSIVDSSTPNAHLAAVLAGFMVTAVVFLLRRESDEKDSASRAHTIAMFLTGVVILGLDSYLFGSIASMHPVTQTQNGIESVRPEAQYVCTVVWTQGMVASGMLAVGGTLLVAGLGWTTTQFAKNAKSESVFFACLGNIVTWAITVTCLAALVDTAVMYIHSMSAPPFNVSMAKGTAVVFLIGLAAAAICTLLIGIRTVGLWCRLSKNRRWLDETNEVNPRYAALATANIFTIALAVGGPTFGYLNHPHPPSVATMWFAVIGCVLLPAAIFIFIAYSVPGPLILWEKTTPSQETVDSEGSSEITAAVTPPESKEGASLPPSANR
jgi:hypothetical protein